MTRHSLPRFPRRWLLAGLMTFGLVAGGAGTALAATAGGTPSPSPSPTGSYGDHHHHQKPPICQDITETGSAIYVISQKQGDQKPQGYGPANSSDKSAAEQYVKNDHGRNKLIVEEVTTTEVVTVCVDAKSGKVVSVKDKTEDVAAVTVLFPVPKV
jgi:hypothetical protein